VEVFPCLEHTWDYCRCLVDFSLVVPAPYGKLTVSAPSNFSVFVDGKPFESGTVAAGGMW